jgi:hypothetical protein
VRRARCLPGASALATLLLIGASTRADAEVRLAPTVGAITGGRTTLFDPEDAAARRKLAIGTSLSVLGQHWLGLEVDAQYIPGFFQQERTVRLVDSSGVGTIMGNVIVAMPYARTGAGLRLFAVGGVGYMRARMIDVNRVAPVRSNLLGASMGAGAEGFLTDRIGLRWDLRYFREISGGDDETLGAGNTELRFWRASMGVVIRLGAVR